MSSTISLLRVCCTYHLATTSRFWPPRSIKGHNSGRGCLELLVYLLSRSSPSDHPLQSTSPSILPPRILRYSLALDIFFPAQQNHLQHGNGLAGQILIRRASLRCC